MGRSGNAANACSFDRRQGARAVRIAGMGVQRAAAALIRRHVHPVTQTREHVDRRLQRLRIHDARDAAQEEHDLAEGIARGGVEGAKPRRRGQHRQKTLRALESHTTQQPRAADHALSARSLVEAEQAAADAERGRGQHPAREGSHAARAFALDLGQSPREVVEMPECHAVRAGGFAGPATEAQVEVLAQAIVGGNAPLDRAANRA